MGRVKCASGGAWDGMERGMMMIPRNRDPAKDRLTQRRRGAEERSGEALAAALLRLAHLLLAVARGSADLERGDQAAGGGGHLVDRAVERLFVAARRAR